MPNKFQFLMVVEVDQDSVPGFGNEDTHWIKFIQRQLDEATHYNPLLTVLDSMLLPKDSGLLFCNGRRRLNVYTSNPPLGSPIQNLASTLAKYVTSKSIEMSKTEFLTSIKHQIENELVTDKIALLTEEGRALLYEIWGGEGNFEKVLLPWHTVAKLDSQGIVDALNYLVDEGLLTKTVSFDKVEYFQLSPSVQQHHLNEPQGDLKALGELNVEQLGSTENLLYLTDKS